MKKNVQQKTIHDLANIFCAILCYSSPGMKTELEKINEAAKEGHKMLRTLDYLERFDSGPPCSMRTPEGTCQEQGLYQTHCDDTKSEESCNGCDFQDQTIYPETKEQIHGLGCNSN